MKASRPVRRWPLWGAAVLLAIAGESIEGSAAEVEITVDLAKPGATISPHIYGQFIEHMGRCIHGGIWAEMLRDRKFLLEPGKSWQIVGPDGADFEIAHDTAGAYCGNHCLALWVRGAPGGARGIRQGDLGVINVPGKPEVVTTTRLSEPPSLERPILLPAHSITVLQVEAQFE